MVDGLIGDAGAMVGRAVAARDGWFDVSTLKEPYRVEGKKTMGLEIAEQLGWRAPDVVVYPTGGGVGLIGIAKAFAELRELGWLTGPATRFVAAQSSGCAPVVRAYEAGAETTEPWPDPRTVAYGITVAAPLGGPQLLRILRESGGTAVAVDDADALATRAECAADRRGAAVPRGRGRAARGPRRWPRGAGSPRPTGWSCSTPAARWSSRRRCPPPPACSPPPTSCPDGSGPHSHPGRACCRRAERDSRSSTPTGRSRSRTAAPRRTAWRTPWPRSTASSRSASATWRPTCAPPADGVAVLLHDARLDRTTDRTGAVRTLPWAEVAKARVGGREPVPRLDELLGSYPDLRVNIDVKTPSAVGPLVEAVRRAGAVDRVCIGSFHDRLVPLVRDRLGERLCTSLGPREVLALRLGALRRTAAGCAQVPPGLLRIRVIDRGSSPPRTGSAWPCTPGRSTTRPR